MPSGLPGFLRRTLRNDYDEGEDDDDDDDANNEDDSLGQDGSDHNLPIPGHLTLTRMSLAEVNNNNNNNANTTMDNLEDYDMAAGRNSVHSSAAQSTTTTTTGKGSTTHGDDTEDESEGDFGLMASHNKQQQEDLYQLNASISSALSSQNSSIRGSSINNNNNTPRQSIAAGGGGGSSASGVNPPKTYRETQFDRILNADVINIQDLSTLAWNGVPLIHRATTWKLLLGYLPVSKARRATTIQRKRSEYMASCVAQHYDCDDDSRTPQEQETLRQVLVDVPRTQPDVPLFRHDKIRRILTRLLYIWAMRHPASSYVQGINDLATPLLAVFLADYFIEQRQIEKNEGNDTTERDGMSPPTTEHDFLTGLPSLVLEGHVMNHFPEEKLDELEADVYWCLTNLLAGIQDHYTADQPGVQRMVGRLEELVNRIDGDLSRHLRDTGILFLQFSFKWMNCLLLREFHLKCVFRLWDTYLSEKDGFEDFHVYVCAAFLCQFSSQLQEMSFDELFQFMQHIPTEDWTDTEIEVLLSQAFVLSTLFKGSDAHLTSTNPNI